jgi:hypothetical protein
MKLGFIGRLPGFEFITVSQSPKLPRTKPKTRFAFDQQPDFINMAVDLLHQVEVFAKLYLQWLRYNTKRFVKFAKIGRVLGDRHLAHFKFLLSHYISLVPYQLVRQSYRG